MADYKGPSTDIGFQVYEDGPRVMDPECRWCQPYQSGHSPGRTEWAVMLKHTLSPEERDYGLKERLVADDLSNLRRKMKLQDEVYKRYRETHTVPAWKHRASD